MQKKKFDTFFFLLFWQENISICVEFCLFFLCQICAVKNDLNLANRNVNATSSNPPKVVFFLVRKLTAEIAYE